MSNSRTIFKHVENLMTIAKKGLISLQEGESDSAISGLYHIAVYGRAVTIALQKLRNSEHNFNSWYKPYVKIMDSDPLMTYFNNLRNTILKEGRSESFTITYKVTFDEPNYHRNKKPPDAIKWFEKDEYGGSGWLRKKTNGVIEKYYVFEPPSVTIRSYQFSNGPQSHRGEDISDYSIVGLSELYIAFLEKIVEEATKEFHN